MTKEELLNEIKEALQREDELTEDMALDDIEEWDSLSVLSIINLYDQLFSIILKYKDIEKFKTVKDLIKSVEDKLDEL